MNESERTLPSVTRTDIEVFSAFYREEFRPLVAFLLWQGARAADAVDIAQETMTKAFQSWSTIEKPHAWVRTVASRERVRRAVRTEEDPVDQVPERSAALRAGVDVEEWEQRHEVLRLLDNLPARQRQIMAWTLDGYSPKEIAEELRIEGAAVRSSLKKARRALAGLLAGEES